MFCSVLEIERSAFFALAYFVLITIITVENNDIIVLCESLDLGFSALLLVSDKSFMLNLANIIDFL